MKNEKNHKNGEIEIHAEERETGIKRRKKKRKEKKFPGVKEGTRHLFTEDFLTANGEAIKILEILLFSQGYEARLSMIHSDCALLEISFHFFL